MIWVFQILLALVFLAAGATKVFTPIADLIPQMAWVAFMPAIAVRIIGLLEVAGGLGLILPWLTGIQPQLVRLAALGLVLTMIGAAITHIAIGDPIVSIFPSLILGAIAGFVAYSRTALLPLGE